MKSGIEGLMEEYILVYVGWDNFIWIRPVIVSAGHGANYLTNDTSDGEAE